VPQLGAAGPGRPRQQSLPCWKSFNLLFRRAGSIAPPLGPPRGGLELSTGTSLTRLRATLGRLGKPLRQSAGCSGVSPSHRPSTGSCHRARALAQQHVPGNGCHLACIQGVPDGSSGAPALSARAIYELGLSPLSSSTIATLSGSHVIAGAAAAMSSLGSAVAVAMMVGGGGTPPFSPPWPRGLVQTGSVHRVGHRLDRF